MKLPDRESLSNTLAEKVCGTLRIDKMTQAILTGAIRVGVQAIPTAVWQFLEEFTADLMGVVEPGDQERLQAALVDTVARRQLFQVIADYVRSSRDPAG